MSATPVAQSTYMQNFPTEVPTKAAQGFIVTAILNILAGRAGSIALLGGTLAAASTVIEAITRPVIKGIFPENPLIAQCIQIFSQKLFVVSVATALTPVLGVTYRATSFVLPIIAWAFLNCQYYEKNIAIAEVL